MNSFWGGIGDVLVVSLALSFTFLIQFCGAVGKIMDKNGFIKGKVSKLGILLTTLFVGFCVNNYAEERYQGLLDHVYEKCVYQEDVSRTKCSNMTKFSELARYRLSTD